MKKIGLLSSLFLSIFIANFAVAEVTIGVMASRGALAAMKDWKEMGKYIKSQANEDVKIVPLDPGKTVKMVKNGKFDYVLANPVLTLTLMKKNDAVPMATIKRKSGSQFGGVIVSKKGSKILKSEDLKQKSVLGFRFGGSAAAYVFQVKHLLDRNIDPYTYFSSFKEARRQDDIVLAVSNGLADAGFIKTGLLEAMEKEGKIKIADFNIVDKQDVGFSQVHTTTLYPEWTMAYLPKAKPEITEKVKAALLKLTATDLASKNAKIHGFVDPVDFAELDETMKILKLGPYKQ